MAEVLYASGASTGPRTAGAGASRHVRWTVYIPAEGAAEQKRARELLAQSLELLKQMQAG
jgi:hypothetical protein